MYSIKEINQIVDNLIRFKDSPPQCPCCEPSDNNHTELSIGDTSIPFQNILEVITDHIDGYIDVGYFDEVKDVNILLKVPEQCFEGFR